MTDHAKDQPAPAATRPPREMPDTFIIIFLVVLLAAASTYWIPAGVFETRAVEYQVGDQTRTRQVLIPESFRYDREADGSVRHHTVSLFTAEADGGARVDRFIPSDAHSERGVFNYVFDGLVSGDRYGAAVGVVVFILIIGGAFGIILRTGAIEAGILHVLRRTAKAEIWCLPVLFMVFSLGGAIFGMGAEAIAMAMIVVPMVIWMGYDSITGVMVTYGASQVGFATSWMNPFSVAIAQGLAGVPVLSGAGFRFGMWAFFTALGIAYVMFYARRVKANPPSSITYASDDWFRQQPREQLASGDGHGGFGLGEKLVLGVFVTGLVWVIWGVVSEGYYIAEIATQFFVTSVACGTVGVIFGLRGMRLNSLADSFREGAANLIGAALVVGMAKGIVLILGGGEPTQPSVINTILHFAGRAIGDLAPTVSAGAMYVFQSGFNFFVPSGTGQAALTMPIMAPLADVSGLSRQVAVLTFQLGDGLTNLIIPTSAALMGTLAVARIKWTTWVRFQWRLQIVFFLTGFGFICAAIATGL